MAWPPTLAEFKDDRDIPGSDTRDDSKLSRQLAASIAFVERVRPEFNYTGEPLFTVDGDGLVVPVPVPTADLELGTIRLAGRWHDRRRSPDGLVAMAELGASRVPSFDPDIDRLLGIGKYMEARFA